MKFILGILNGEKGKAFHHGKALDLLTLSTVVVQSTAEKVAEEKGISLEAAVDFVCESVKEASKTLK